MLNIFLVVCWITGVLGEDIWGPQTFDELGSDELTVSRDDNSSIIDLGNGTLPVSLKTEVKNEGFGKLTLDSKVEAVTYKSKAQELLDLEAAFDKLSVESDGYYKDSDVLLILYPYLMQLTNPLQRIIIQFQQVITIQHSLCCQAGDPVCCRALAEDKGSSADDNTGSRRRREVGDEDTVVEWNSRQDLEEEMRKEEVKKEFKREVGEWIEEDMQADQEQRKLIEEREGKTRVMKRHAGDMQERSIEAEEMRGSNAAAESDESEDAAHFFQVPLQNNMAGAPGRRKRGTRKLLSIDGCEFGNTQYMSGDQMLGLGCFDCFCHLSKPQCSQNQKCNLDSQQQIVNEENLVEALLVGRTESRGGYSLAKQGFSAAKKVIRQREQEIIGGMEHIIGNEQNLRRTKVFKKLYEELLKWIKQIEEKRIQAIETYTQQLTVLERKLMNHEL